MSQSHTATFEFHITKIARGFRCGNRTPILHIYIYIISIISGFLLLCDIFWYKLQCLFTSESSHLDTQHDGEDIATGGGNDGVIPGLHSEWGYGNTVKFAVDYKHGTWASV